MDTIDISGFSLMFAFFLLAIPFFIGYFLKIGFGNKLFFSVLRMSFQLLLVGFFLKYLFSVNNPLLNLLWLMVMTLVAVSSVIRSSELKRRKIFLPTFLSFLFATFLVVLYLNFFVIRLDYVFDARYLVVLGGMLLGNSLQGNIVGLENFYESIRKDKRRFLYLLSLGASRREALHPYLRSGVLLALKPTFASMATMGIVALPGMMTGVILAGTDPVIAIKYQMVIMVAILVSTTVSVVLTILSSLPICFTRYGMLREDIFLRSHGD